MTQKIEPTLKLLDNMLKNPIPLPENITNKSGMPLAEINPDDNAEVAKWASFMKPEKVKNVISLPLIHSVGSAALHS